MEYIGYIFGIFGLFAFLQVSSLKGRLVKIEEQLANMNGTSQYDERQSLYQHLLTCIGQHVELSLKEDYEDLEIRSGDTYIEDTDGEWVVVRIENKRGTTERIIRLAGISGISLKE